MYTVKHTGFLKCNLSKNEMQVDFTLEDTDVAEIGSELSDTLPAIVLFRTQLRVDEMAGVPSILLIYFNPLNTPLNMKGTYKNSFTQLQRQLGNRVKSIELNDVGDFRQEIVEARARGLTGNMADPIVPVKQTYGREVV